MDGYPTNGSQAGLEVGQEVDVPAWHTSVETWDVIDNGKAIGRFYLDMHPRAGKHTGNAWTMYWTEFAAGNCRRRLWFAIFLSPPRLTMG